MFNLDILWTGEGSPADDSISNKSQELPFAAKVQLMPEYLVVCGWRSIKEVSLLLGYLVSHSPLASSSSDGSGEAGGLITLQQVCYTAYFLLGQSSAVVFRQTFSAVTCCLLVYFCLRTAYYTVAFLCSGIH